MVPKSKVLFRDWSSHSGVLLLKSKSVVDAKT